MAGEFATRKKTEHGAMSRPREFETGEVLQRAMMAFWRGGYQGTGMQDLVESTGINRASLYGAFGNKQQLFLSALNRYTEICLGRLRASLESASTPIAGIRRMLDDFMAGTSEAQRGCLLYNTALEVASHDEEIRNQVENGLKRIELLVDGHLRRAQQDGSIDPSVDSLLLTRVVMAAMQSIAVWGGTGAAPEVLESIRDGALLVFRPAGGQ